MAEKRQAGEHVAVCVECECIYTESEWHANDDRCPNCGGEVAQVYVATDEEVQ